MCRVISLLGVVALMLFAVGSAGAQNLVPCDSLTGGGFIITTQSGSPAHGNFGVGGSCKQGGDGHGLWGHLEYHDHGTGLNVHWTSITAYGEVFTGSDAKGRPIGTRLICGTARTNQTSGEVNWAVTATDNGEPGKINNDLFSIQVLELAYSQAGPLQGGNIQLHKPNKSTGFFGDEPNSTNCPAFVPPPTQCTTNNECTQADCNTTTGTCCPEELPAFQNGVCVLPD
jgi:hypothetical protein